MKVGYAAVAITLLLFSAAWAIPAYGDDDGPSIIFDLNGGTINGNSTFVMTAEDLSGGLPGVTGAVMPTGADEFVVWSTSLSNRENLYNPGDEAPDVPRLYAIWGTKLSSPGNITIPGSGCYIIENTSNKTLDITSPNASGTLIVLRNIDHIHISVNRNVTFIVQGTNTDNTFNGWDNFRLEFSSASTGSISFNSSIYSGGPVVLRGNITTTGGIQGSSVDIDGNVSASQIYSSGPVTINGNVSSTGQIIGSTVTLEGTVSAGNVHTAGDLVIDGNVTVDTFVWGGNINITGTLVADTLYAGGSLVIDDFAVVKVVNGDVPSVGKYIVFVLPDGFVTEGVTNIIVQFKITGGGDSGSISVILPGFDDKINLGEGISVVQENNQYKMDIYYMKDGTEWHSEGSVGYTSGNPGYYTCTLGEPSEVTDPNEEPDLSFISKPPSVTASLYVYILKGTPVKLISTGTELNVSILGNNTVTISIPESSKTYGYWGSLDAMTPDDDTDNEYTIMDDGFDSCGTFIIFVNSGTEIVPVCIVTVSGIEFDTVPQLSFV